jgi:hypothetical protein
MKEPILFRELTKVLENHGKKREEIRSITDDLKKRLEKHGCKYD